MEGRKERRLYRKLQNEIIFPPKCNGQYFVANLVSLPPLFPLLSDFQWLVKENDCNLIQIATMSV